MRVLCLICKPVVRCVHVVPHSLHVRTGSCFKALPCTYPRYAYATLCFHRVVVHVLNQKWITPNTCLYVARFVTYHARMFVMLQPTLSLAEAVDELRALAALSSARSPEQPVLCTRISFELSRMLHAVALCATHSGSIEFDYAYCELLEAVAMSSAIGATACLRSNAQNATLPMMTAHPNDSKVALPVVKCHYACLHHHPQLIDTPIFQNKGVMDMFKFLSKSRLAVSADGVDHAKAVLDLLRGHK